MAINFRAGLDEIQQSGNIMGQGLANLTQQRAQNTQAMLGIEGQKQQSIQNRSNQLFQQTATQLQTNRQIQQQNVQTKAAESQALFDAATSAANTFANIKKQQDQAARDKVQDERQQTQWDQSQTAYKQQEAQKNIAAQAVIEGNKAKAAMKEKGRIVPGAMAAEESYVVVPDSITNPLEQATYIAQREALNQKEIENKFKIEDRALDKRKAEADIAASVASVELGEKRLKWDMVKDARERRMQELEMNIKTSDELAKETTGINKKILIPNYIYTANQTPETIKAQQASKDAIVTKVQTLDNTRKAIDTFFQATKIDPKEFQNPDDAFAAASAAIDKMPDGSPEQTKLKQLRGILVLGGKEPGMAAGGFSPADYALMEGKSGSDALNHLAVLGEAGDNTAIALLKKLASYKETSFVRKGKVIGMGRLLMEREATTKKEIAAELSNSGGLFTFDKDQRNAIAYNMIPPSQRGMEENKVSPKAFAQKTFKEQIFDIYGPDSAGIDIERAVKNDFYNSNPQEILNEATKRASQWKAGGNYLTEEDKTYLNNRYQNLIGNSAGSKDRNPKSETGSGVNVNSNPPGLYPIETRSDGSSRAIISGNGIPVYAGNPMSNQMSMITDPYASVMQGGSHYSPSPAIKKPAIGKKSFKPVKGAG